MAKQTTRQKKLPPLDPKCPGIPKDNRYKEQYGVILICPNEDTQQKVFEGLRAITDCKLRVVVT